MNCGSLSCNIFVGPNGDRAIVEHFLSTPPPDDSDRMVIMQEKLRRLLDCFLKVTSTSFWAIYIMKLASGRFYEPLQRVTHVAGIHNIFRGLRGSDGAWK